MQVIEASNTQIHHSSRLLISPPNDPRKLLNLNILPNNSPLRLILLIQRHLHQRPLRLPSTVPTDKLLKRLALQPQPALQDRSLDLSHRLRDGQRDTGADQVFEAGHVGDEVGVEVVAVQRAPEGGVGGLAEEVVEDVELLHGFGEGGVASSWEGGRGRDGREDVWWEEVECEGEVG